MTTAWSTIAKPDRRHAFKDDEDNKWADDGDNYWVRLEDWELILYPTVPGGIHLADGTYLADGSVIPDGSMWVMIVV